MEKVCELAPGTVFGGNFSEAAAWARKLVARGEWTREEALIFTETAYKRTMIEQIIGVPQAARPEELPEDAILFSNISCT